MTARAEARAPPAQDTLRIAGQRPLPTSFSPLPRSCSLPAPEPQDYRHQRSPCNGRAKYGDRGAIRASSLGRFFSRERVLVRPVALLGTGGRPAARRPHRSVERCCHISRGLRELSEPARARISKQILRSGPSALPQAQQASKPCLRRSFGRSRPMKTSRVWRGSCSFHGR